jgi:hypothetical protein
VKKTVTAVVIVPLLFLLAGCATFYGRPAPPENHSLSPGKIEGNQFTGIRYPFKVSAPAEWKMTMEFPDFLQDLGYDRSDPNDKEQTELYVFNPSTHSNLQFDLTPAASGAITSEKDVEDLVGAGGSSLVDEWAKEGVKVKLSPTTPFVLKGARYAAKKYATYVLNGIEREQGWIYGFADPYQIFISYILMGRQTADRQDLSSILDSFEVTAGK